MGTHFPGFSPVRPVAISRPASVSRKYEPRLPRAWCGRPTAGREQINLIARSEMGAGEQVSVLRTNQRHSATPCARGDVYVRRYLGHGQQAVNDGLGPFLRSFLLALHA